MEFTIKLYDSSIALRSEKLFMVDDFETYLETLTPVLTKTIQFQKVALNLSIKLILDENQTWLLKSNAIYYARITGYDTRSIYYYVKKVNWSSQSCCNLEMVLDTLNTFKIGTDYNFNKRTHITRTHKDRILVKTDFTKVSDLHLTTGDRADFSRDIRVNNGYYLVRQDFITDIYFYPDPITIKLFYQNAPYQFSEDQLESDIVKVYQLTTNGSEITLSWGLFRNEEQIDNGDLEISNHQFKLYLSQDEVYNGGLNLETYWGDSAHFYEFAVVLVAIGTLGEFIRKIDILGEDINPILYHQTSKDITLYEGYDRKAGLYNQEWYLLYQKNTIGSETKPVKVYSIPKLNVYFKKNGEADYTFIARLENLDRSLSNNIKLFSTPYYVGSNSSVSHDTLNTYILNEDRQWESSKMSEDEEDDNFFITFNTRKYIDGEYTTRELEIETANNPISSVLKMDISTFTKNMNRNNYLESKLFHSEFFFSKFYYDSFSLSFNYELIKATESALEETLRIDYTFSTTLSSNFIFIFKNYTCGDLSQEDYNNTLIVKRNNEITLYSDSYLDYLKNGFNYDKKNKEQQSAVNWSLTGVSLIGTAISTASAVATEGITIPLAVASAVSTISSLTNAISQQVSSERGIQQKIQQLKAQATSVSGADDIDLLLRYSPNKLQYTEYTCSPTMKNLIADLFYYMGYRENKMGIPDTTSRTRFNFLACEPVLDISSINMSEEVRIELENIMKMGFTRIHHYANTWDFSQEKENWETSIVSYIPD